MESIDDLKMHQTIGLSERVPISDKTELAKERMLSFSHAFRGALPCRTFCSILRPTSAWMFRPYSNARQHWFANGARQAVCNLIHQPGACSSMNASRTKVPGWLKSSSLAQRIGASEQHLVRRQPNTWHSVTRRKGRLFDLGEKIHGFRLKAICQP